MKVFVSGVLKRACILLYILYFCRNGKCVNSCVMQLTSCWLGESLWLWFRQQGYAVRNVSHVLNNFDACLSNCFSPGTVRYGPYGQPPRKLRDAMGYRGRWLINYLKVKTGAVSQSPTGLYCMLFKRTILVHYHDICLFYKCACSWWLFVLKCACRLQDSDWFTIQLYFGFHGGTNGGYVLRWWWR